MPRTKVQAVCGSCRLQSTCQDAATLQVLRDFLENSGMAAELTLTSRARYRLGCDRYRPDRGLRRSVEGPSSEPCEREARP